MSTALLDGSPSTDHETGDHEREKNYKDNPCNLSRGAGYTRQAEDFRNESNDEKDPLNIVCASFV
jgi:hypothetical protein